MAAVTNSFTDTIAMSYSGNGKVVSSKTGSYTGTHDAGIATVIAAGAVNVPIDVVFPFATIQSCCVETDQDLTVKVNSTTTPVPQLVVKGTAGLFWATNFQAACPFTADVTVVYVSNAGAVDAKFNIRVLYN